MAPSDELKPGERRVLTGVGGTRRRVGSVDVELFVTSSELDGEEITAHLEMAPAQAFLSSSRRDGKPTGERAWLWRWTPARSVPREFEAQLAALWAETTPREPAFQALGQHARVVIAITLHSTDGFMLLCPSLKSRHLARAVSIGAEISVRDMADVDVPEF